MTLHTGTCRDGSAEIKKRSGIHSEVLNPRNKDKVLPTPEGESVPFKETGMFHKAEKESQALAGAENAMRSRYKWAFSRESRGHVWVLDHFHGSLTFHWKLYWQLYMYLIQQIRKTDCSPRTYIWDKTQSQCSNYKIWLNTSANYFLLLTTYLEINKTIMTKDTNT